MKTYPLKASHLVSIDLEIKGGLCCIDGTRLTTEIMGRCETHERVMCEQYDITLDQLNAAKRYERKLKAKKLIKCKHSWDRAGSYRYCNKCDRLQRLIFPGYDNFCSKDKWEDIGT